MWTKDLKFYPLRLQVQILADRKIVGHILTVAAEVFADDYLEDIASLKHPADRPPCADCTAKAIYLCYLTGCECRAWAVWDQYWDRMSTKMLAENQPQVNKPQ